MLHNTMLPRWRHQMEKKFRVTGPLCGEFTGHRWIPCTKALMFSLISAWISGWAKNLEAGDLGRHRAHYDVTVMDHPVDWRLHLSPNLNIVYPPVIYFCRCRYVCSPVLFWTALYRESAGSTSLFCNCNMMNIMVNFTTASSIKTDKISPYYWPFENRIHRKQAVPLTKGQ